MEKEGTFENWMLEIPNRWSTIFQSFIDLGMYDLSGMGDFIPLSWQTLHAYASCTDALHEEWQFLAIRQMSTKYLEGMHSGVEPLSIPPWLRDEDGYCEPSISS